MNKATHVVILPLPVVLIESGGATIKRYISKSARMKVMRSAQRKTWNAESSWRRWWRQRRRSYPRISPLVATMRANLLTRFGSGPLVLAIHGAARRNSSNEVGAMELETMRESTLPKRIQVPEQQCSEKKVWRAELFYNGCGDLSAYGFHMLDSVIR